MRGKAGLIYRWAIQIAKAPFSGEGRLVSAHLALGEISLMRTAGMTERLSRCIKIWREYRHLLELVLAGNMQSVFPRRAGRKLGEMDTRNALSWRTTAHIHLLGRRDSNQLSDVIGNAAVSGRKTAARLDAADDGIFSVKRDTAHRLAKAGGDSRVRCGRYGVSKSAP